MENTQTITQWNFHKSVHNDKIKTILCFFFAGIPTYLGPLDGNTDIGTLAGKALIVTEKDLTHRRSHSSLSKAASIGFRTRQSRFFSSASTEEPVDESKILLQKHPKQKWSLQLFGAKNSHQQSQLCELLNTFTKNGVPQPKSSIIERNEYKEAVEALSSLPLSWSEIVTRTGRSPFSLIFFFIKKSYFRFADMSEAEIKMQNVIWELVTTEVDYIQCLRTVTDVSVHKKKIIQFQILFEKFT